MSDEKKLSTVPVSMVAKAVVFKKGNRKNWAPPRLDDALRQVLAQSPSVADRHHPSASAIKLGDQCLFINRAKDLGSSGVLVEICTYQVGHVPESMTPDLAAKEISLQKVTLVDDNGKQGELVHSFRIVALGEILIIQATRGQGGGARAVQALFTNLFRRHLADPHHPSLDLSDIGSADLRILIAQKGGVKKIVAKIAATTVESDSRFAGMLFSTKKQVNHAASCTVTWEASDKLDEDASIAALEESEDDSLDSVVLYFKLGGSVSNLSKYRERRTFFVEALPDGRPAVSEIDKKLVQYMDDLRSPSNDGPVSTDGSLKNAKLISVG